MALPNQQFQPPRQPVLHEVGSNISNIVRTSYRCPQKDGSLVLQIGYQCTKCTMEPYGRKAMEKHMSEVHNDAEFKLPKADDTTGLVTKLRFPNGDAALICPMCGEQFPETAMEELHVHARKQHGEDWNRFSSSVAKRGADGRDYYVCDYCEMHFSSAPACTRHVASEHGEVWKLTDDPDSHSSVLFDYIHMGRTDDRTFPRQQDFQSRMQLVSLGSFCGVKFSMQRMGLGSSHMPFDWIRTNITGVRDFVRNGFDEFFSITTQLAIESAAVHMFRSSKHCFFHDDITKEDIQTKLRRRAQRFVELRESTMDLLFVRSLADVEGELTQIDDLHADLCNLFGNASRRVLLLVVVDGQSARQGPIAHRSNPSITFVLQPYDESAMNPDGGAYCNAIALAADLALNVPETSSPLIGFGPQPGQLSVLNSVALLKGHVEGVQPGSVCATPWDAGLTATFDGNSYSCFDGFDAQHYNLSTLRKGLSAGTSLRLE